MASKIIMDSFSTGENIIETTSIITLDTENEIPFIKVNNKRVYKLLETNLSTGEVSIKLTTIAPMDRPDLQILPLEFDITI